MLQQAAPVASKKTLAKGGPWRNQYGGCWTHTDDLTLKSPQNMSKKDFGELLIQLCSALFQTSVTSGKKARLNILGRAGVWQELHKNGKPHYHFILSAEDPWSFVPLARALREKGINVDFSFEHDYYWTNVVYLAVPSAFPGGKQLADLDNDPW